jgi:hypothetical protein
MFEVEPGRARDEEDLQFRGVGVQTNLKHHSQDKAKASCRLPRTLWAPDPFAATSLLPLFDIVLYNLSDNHGVRS